MATIFHVTSTLSEYQSSKLPLSMLMHDKTDILEEDKYESYKVDANTPHSLEDEDESYDTCCSSYYPIHIDTHDHNDVSNSTEFRQEKMYSTESDDEQSEDANQFDHPFLNMEEQYEMIRRHRQEIHSKWTEKMSEGLRLSHFNRKIAIKVLLSEAQSRDENHIAKEQAKLAEERCRVRVEKRRQQERIEKEMLGDSYDEDALTTMSEMRDIYNEEDYCASEEAIHRVRMQWKCITDKVMEEMYFFDNSPVVLKNMSCMCVFIPENICREYGDNLYLRQERVAKQQRLLDRLREERRLFVNGPSDYDIENSEEVDV